MSYSKTISYLFSRLPMFHRIGAAAYKADLNTTIKIASVLGNPELKFPSIHIAGTNGKGSTSHYLASILQEAGYKTALFTSPHLKDFRERIRIDGKMIPKGEVVNFVRLYKPEFEALQPSFFEWTFALASWYFAESEVDIAVMETGMGGRLDSTNIVRPVLSVITNIGFDHTQFLGDTLSAIAREKAGIIKPRMPVVIGEVLPETESVFTETAVSNHSEIIFAERQYKAHSYKLTGSLVRRLRIQYETAGQNDSVSLSSPLTGKYQLKNLATVLAAVGQLRQLGFNISDGHLKSGVQKVVRNTGLQGRWQVIGLKPLTIADIGHNADCIREVMENISLTPHRRLHIVLGVVNDKDVTAMLALLPEDADYYFCKADIPRGLDAHLLAGRAGEAGLTGKVFESVQAALQSARSSADPSDLIVVTGSAFVVAEAI